ncbi:bifunctional 2-polyprenyl-6-hydroxyphenol methylase/3-demethylubiquinol 3-O-methyltransferase UbiG [Mycolicibacterium sp. P1-5]|uniref:class I SAM-dependent methyltransferase n=1 Tax=Mycolicibacterium sp. P1-5 TaxID=2024617 RepID=UPI0011EBA17D|nr:class I SAM-dependent methyltransferase [Mycolicibacterium sp. P1-5]KAA0110375.1 class I SAM-dependent methyltransferase [Mycolicibacterium sp. P1-5]
MDDRPQDAVGWAQDVAHGLSHDYIAGSPHLRHQALTARIEGRIRQVIEQVLARKGEASVLEIGAGHGFFTATVLDAGGHTTVTEMSKASFDYLERRYHDNRSVRVIYDKTGDAAFNEGGKYDVILLISVIHHIPDYISTIERLCDELLDAGGAIVTFQDPLWYPRQTGWAKTLSQGAYFMWRLGQGDLRRGLATRWRRLRGVYSESEPSDLVEYHVVRQGVDDQALMDMFRMRFSEVELDRYFSTQSPLLQKYGQKVVPPNTFGIVARGRKP